VKNQCENVNLFLHGISMLAGKHWQTAGHASEEGLQGMMKLTRTVQFSGAKVVEMKRMKKMRIGSPS